MAIDPKQILHILGDLLTPWGGIKSPDDVIRVYQLMQKFSRKMVSKVIYINILKNTSDDIMLVFLIGSGWQLLTQWLSDSMTLDNSAVMCELIHLFAKLPMPVGLNPTEVNKTKNLLGKLCGHAEIPENIVLLAIKVVTKWNSNSNNEDKRRKSMAGMPEIKTKKISEEVHVDKIELNDNHSGIVNNINNDSRMDIKFENLNEIDVNNEFELNEERRSSENRRGIVDNINDNRMDIKFENLNEIDVNNEVELNVERRSSENRRGIVDNINNDIRMDVEVEPLNEIDVNNEYDRNELELNIRRVSTDNGRRIVDNINNDNRMDEEVEPLNEIDMNNEYDRNVKRVSKTKNKPKKVTSNSRKMDISAKQVESKDAFRKHIKVVEEEDGTEVYVCRSAECSFSPTLLESKATKHAILHSKGSKKKTSRKKPNVQCSKCMFNCSRKVELNKHWKNTHAEKEKILCSQCLKSFSSQQSLRRHISTIHVKFTNQHAVSCILCNKTYRDETCLNRHIQNVHSEKMFQCHICPKSFARQAALSNHVNKNHDESGKVQCEVCWKMFENDTQLVLHSKVHQKSGTPTKKCNMCPQEFSCESNLKRHIRVVHEKKKTLKCKWCDKYFRDNWHKERHEVTNHLRGKDDTNNLTNNGFIDEEVFLFNPPVAIDSGPVVMEEIILGVNEITVGDEIKLNFCAPPRVMSCINSNDSETYIEVGKFSFSAPAVIDSEKGDVYIDDPDFNFSIPSHAFGSSLMDSPENNSVIKCQLCNSTFSKQFYLKEHMKSVHSFKFVHCEKCEKDFESKYSFYQHRPCLAKCPLCDQTFSRVFFLKHHLKALHKV